jgi:ornithine carbamoyltransferase
MIEVPEHLKGRRFTRINDWSHDELRDLLDLADELKGLQARREPHRVLPGRTVGLLFELPSTRTRASFAVAAEHLGAGAIALDADRTHLSRGESLADTAASLSRYLDALVYRARRQEDLDELAAAATIPVLNGLTEKTNPCQTLADLMTIRERAGRLSGVRLAYVGDGNNVCRSLMRGAAKFGMRFTAATPPDYTPAQEAIDQTRKAAIQQGGTVEFTHEPRKAVEHAEVLYTSEWIGLGREGDREQHVAALQGFGIDDDLLALAGPNAFVMHCLPARPGEEITADLLYGPRSAVWDQVENRLHVDKALLALVMR